MTWDSTANRSCSNVGSPASRCRRQRGRRDLGGRPSWRERAALKVPVRAPCAAAKVTELAAACSQASSPRCCSVQPGIGATLTAACSQTSAPRCCSVQRRLGCCQAPGVALGKVRRRQRQAGCGRGGPPALVCGHDEECEREPRLAVAGAQQHLVPMPAVPLRLPAVWAVRPCLRAGTARSRQQQLQQPGWRVGAACRLHLLCGTACTAGPCWQAAALQQAATAAAAAAGQQQQASSLGRSSSLGSLGSLGSSSSSSSSRSRLQAEAASAEEHPCCCAWQALHGAG